VPAPEREAEDAAADQVAAFLRARPGFLAERPDLYRALVPPQRIHGEALADHMMAMLRAERRHAAAMAEQANGVLAAGRAAAGLALRVQDAVLALIDARDVADCVAHALPGALAVDAASLCLEAGVAGARSLPAGTVARLLGGRNVVIRDTPSDAALLHGEAARLARRDALVRVPWSGGPALLALVSRDPAALESGPGGRALAFLGRAVGAALSRAADHA
jgi:uncharacterized protein YigA (DUF484 family)